MANDPTSPGRGQSPIQQAAAAAMQEVLSKTTLDALLNTSPAEVIKPTPEAETVKGSANRSGGWLCGPAQFGIFANADKRLTRLSAIEGRPVKQVDKVQPELIKGTTVLILRTAPAEDLTAIPVRRYPRQSGAWINLYSLLGPAGLTVQTGYKELYDIAWVPKESPFWPALVIDLGKPLGRRLVKRYTQQPEPDADADTDIELEDEADTETP